eukprot:CAMPEP_0178445944 /NCGR_PEP_ID=MMETSP0689_2-20121128/40489_1 /TAXON_ID=160604 /ORGANISM="Amphidinium massartii, Strain CS-259" /LENGTH=69 /DNA_ID=CAMNT_0020070633 /DNA_START=131 /DNA_END=336 /DNA_ORIENTATION=+
MTLTLRQKQPRSRDEMGKTPSIRYFGTSSHPTYARSSKGGLSQEELDSLSVTEDVSIESPVSISSSIAS